MTPKRKYIFKHKDMPKYKISIPAEHLMDAIAILEDTIITPTDFKHLRTTTVKQIENL